ncbi:hypothetical protein VTJ83DRAFT_5701 [Remersonia thermophila]|uniref:Altered inheritance of mitochondria protein 6 n=1 Tax=Remersonia thermophila TaxID=72144 RepID=A0ABR4D7K6_9PEZI
MASWRSEKKLMPEGKAEYAPIAQGDEESRVHDSSDGSTETPRHKRRWKWSRPSCMFGVASLSVALLVADVGDKIARNLVGMRRPDPFENWGRPGTGTEDLAWYPTDFLRDVMPVPCHSHNDYWRKVPLFSALYAGCTGVEADVWLRNGDLLVGHEKASLQPNRTFQTLYVNPLVEILTRKNAEPGPSGPDGRAVGVFDTDPAQTLVLLVDLKTDGPTTWPWVMQQLAPLRDRGWLSYYEDGQFHQQPITVVGTGNTPFDQIVSLQPRRDAFFDAPLDKLENSPFNWTNSYYASVSFWKAIGAVWWKGGPGVAQLATIRAHLREARERGLVSRYWALPAWPIHVRNRLWQLLVEEGIGMLNVDDLEAATQQDWTKPRAL